MHAISFVWLQDNIYRYVCTYMHRRIEKHLLFHHVTINIWRNNCNCHNISSRIYDFTNFLVVQSYNILAIHLQTKSHFKDSMCWCHKQEYTTCIFFTALTFDITKLTSTRLCAINKPFLAADEPTTMPLISPSLNWNPIWPVESLWRVMVLSKGLKCKWLCNGKLFFQQQL